MKLQLGRPEPLTAAHRLDRFNCGEPVLNDWLKRRAMTNQMSGASRTFVVADPQHCVYGYYALAAGAVAHQVATAKVRRNMPDPIPVLVLARLAVDTQTQGIHLGAGLLQDAVSRAVAVSQDAGVRALVVHAINEQAKQFYEYFGFSVSAAHPMTLMLRLGSPHQAQSRLA